LCRAGATTRNQPSVEYASRRVGPNTGSTCRAVVTVQAYVARDVVTTARQVDPVFGPTRRDAYSTEGWLLEAGRQTGLGRTAGSGQYLRTSATGSGGGAAATV
jgi:hypothetical protein